MSEHQCVYSRDIIEGVLIKMASCMIELTPEESDPSKKKFIKKVTPLEDWILEQQTQNP